SYPVLPSPDRAFFEQSVLKDEFGHDLLQRDGLPAQILDLVRGRCPCRVAGEALFYQPPETPLTSGNRGSARSPRAGTARRCCPRRASRTAQCGSSPPPKTAAGWRGGSP